MQRAWPRGNNRANLKGPFFFGGPLIFNFCKTKIQHTSFLYKIKNTPVIGEGAFYRSIKRLFNSVFKCLGGSELRNLSSRNLNTCSSFRVSSSASSSLFDGENTESGD